MFGDWMGTAVAAIGVLIGVIGVIGVVSPGILLSTAVDGLRSSPRRIYGLAAVRLIMGVAASSTAFPTFVLIIGAVFILRAAMIPLLGLDRVRSLIEWLQGRSSLVMRLLFLAGVVPLGVFLVLAAIEQ
jgi:hypothetical protein